MADSRLINQRVTDGFEQPLLIYVFVFAMYYVFFKFIRKTLKLEEKFPQSAQNSQNFDSIILLFDLVGASALTYMTFTFCPIAPDTWLHCWLFALQDWIIFNICPMSTCLLLFIAFVCILIGVGPEKALLINDSNENISGSGDRTTAPSKSSGAKESKRASQQNETSTNDKDVESSGRTNERERTSETHQSEGNRENKDKKSARSPRRRKNRDVVLLDYDQNSRIVFGKITAKYQDDLKSPPTPIWY